MQSVQDQELNEMSFHPHLKGMESVLLTPMSSSKQTFQSLQFEHDLHSTTPATTPLPIVSTHGLDANLTFTISAEDFVSSLAHSFVFDDASLPPLSTDSLTSNDNGVSGKETLLLDNSHDLISNPFGILDTLETSPKLKQESSPSTPNYTPHRFARSNAPPTLMIDSTKPVNKSAESAHVYPSFRLYRDTTLESPLVTPSSAFPHMPLNAASSPLIQSAPISTAFNPYFPSHFLVDNSQLYSSQPSSPLASPEQLQQAVDANQIRQALLGIKSSSGKLVKKHHSRTKSVEGLLSNELENTHLNESSDSPLSPEASQSGFPSDDDIRMATEAAANGSRSLMCTFPGCDRVFTQFQNLKSHWRCHSEIKRFACDECDARFRRLPDLYRHRRSLHGAGKPHECENCGKSFARADALRRHIQSKNRPRGCGSQVVPALSQDSSTNSFQSIDLQCDAMPFVHYSQV